ncbi:metallophosphoesterase [Hydrogenibacillus sp. N12]|uniref:metallophosphoesterase family protein n=1 Tax=Hydrogenibacillus sp. N12 TaxID=2866627 RepID=UPI001C7CF0D3|nr:metallophosphoesterase [Hydrogenibacillus sp. N12]QZA32380.1 metallophosphoesterase [Hydrogenibacillus sp. N12]
MTVRFEGALPEGLPAALTNRERMEFLVMSDSHGLVEAVEAVVQRHPGVRGIHCGDVVAPVDRPPFAELLIVAGNQDRGAGLPAHRLLRWEGEAILVTHGHRFDVQADLLKLRLFAEAQGARIVFYGHTHVPGWTVDGGVLLLNPGSLARPRGYPHPTYAVVRLHRSEAGVEVEISYYDLAGRKQEGLSGRTVLSGTRPTGGASP